MKQQQDNTAIGFVGLGSMGAGMATCLLRNGWTVHVHARRSHAMIPFVQLGATAHDSAATLASACNVIILSLPDAVAVEEVLFGKSGLTEGLNAGACVIDTSTIAATSAKSIAARLAARHIDFLDAPVSGGQSGAEAGTLACMVGGDAQVLDKVHGILSAFCKTITHVGTTGAGQTVKACNQVAVAGAMLGVADALALARAQGVDPMIMREVLLQGSARSFPLEKHAPRIIREDFKPGFRAKLMRKDLRLALDTAQASKTSLAATPVAERLLDTMCTNGREDWDWCAVATELWRRESE